MRGILIDEQRVLVTDAEGSKPVRDVAAPEAPDGYMARGAWVDTGAEIVRSWRLEPEGGTAADAAVELARIQAQSLSDADAVRVAPLYDEWSGDGVEYKTGDRRRYQGYLVKCLQDHTSQPDWAPNAAPSLWAVILPGQDGSGVEVGVWQQPGSTNGYSTGDKVIHKGHLWQSKVDDNVDEPGTDNGFRWTDLGEWEASVQASAKSKVGAHFPKEE